MADPEAYKRKHGPPSPEKQKVALPITVKLQKNKSKVELLIDESQEILRAAFIHTKWVMTVEKQVAGKCPSDGKILERILGVLGKDQQWMQKTAVFFLFFFLEICSMCYLFQNRHF
jgi:hypothetical protein